MDVSRKLQACFKTKLSMPLRVPSTSMYISSAFTRKNLSEIVNAILLQSNLEHEQQPFDFIIDGELLRGTTIEDLLIRKGITTERVLEIEYVKVVRPKEKQSSLLEDSWVSSVDSSNPSLVLTGCSDKLARIWNSGAVCTHVLEGHTCIVSCSKIIKKGINNDENEILAVTGSKDCTLRLWKFNVVVDPSSVARIKPHKLFSGHEFSVSSVAANPSGDMVCSGSWDCSLKLWMTHTFHDEDDRKFDQHCTAASTFTGHTDCAKSVAWPDTHTIFSGSWDRSLRQWDVETGKQAWSVISRQAINYIDVGGEGSKLIAVGRFDTVSEIWDPRLPGTLAPIFKFSSHTDSIHAFKWHPTSYFHLLSASQDGTAMIWDIRAHFPLAKIKSHNGPMFCGDWWGAESVVTGGYSLSMHSGIEVLP